MMGWVFFSLKRRQETSFFPRMLCSSITFLVISMLPHVALLLMAANSIFSFDRWLPVLTAVLGSHISV